MLVCHCNSVTERTIREAVRSGANSAAAVARHCGAGTECGGCRELVEHIVGVECLAAGGPRRCHAPAPEAEPVSAA